MAVSDPDVTVGALEDSLDFDVTKEHGLNSDNEDDIEEDQEDTDAPPKKKKKFKPWKMFRKVFKKGKKAVPDEKAETGVDEDQVVSTEQIIPPENSVPQNAVDVVDKEDSSKAEISRRESDEGLPLSPDTPSLNFDLDKNFHPEESLDDSGDMSLDVEERNNAQVNKGLYHPTPSPRLSLRHNSEERSGSDFDSVTTSPTLNNDAAKHKISIKPSTRRPTTKHKSPQRTTPTAFDFDANSFSFASESMDEESEMEEKSAMSIAMERKDTEFSKEGKRPLNGILDQLIEESKEAYTYDIDPVEVQSSDGQRPRLNKKEETGGPEEADDKYMFNSQTVMLEEEREDGGVSQDEEEIQEAKEKPEEDEDEAADVMENSILEEVEIEKKSEIDPVRVEGGFPAKIDSVVVISEEMGDVRDKNQNDIDEHTVKFKDIEVTKVNQEGDGVSSSNEEETEIKLVATEVAPLKVSEEKEDKVKELEELVIEEDKPVINQERNVPVKEKPSPTPRPRSTPQIKPRVSFADNNNLEERKDMNDNEERPVSVKDRISRFQSKSFTSETAAPIKRAPRWNTQKSKQSSPSPAPSERRSTTPPTTMSNSVPKRKVETPPSLSRDERAKSTPERRQPQVKQKLTKKFEKESTRVTPPKRYSPPSQRRESQNEESNIQSRGGVKALIMKFQETKPQVNSGTRAANAAS